MFVALRRACLLSASHSLIFPSSMIISNPTSSPLYDQISITYTVEAGDPPQFFFEIVENERQIDVSNKQAFSTSGSFFTIPGDLGLHFIEAYSSTDIVGESQPFAKGPTYTVVPVSSTGTTTPAAPNPPPTSPLPTNTVAPTPSGTKQNDSTDNRDSAMPDVPDRTSGPSTPSYHSFISACSCCSNCCSRFSTPNSVLESPTPLVIPSTTTLYESLSGGVITVGGEQTASPLSSSSSPPPGVPSGTTAKSRNPAPIIGAAVGGAIIVLAVCAFFLVRRCRRPKPPNQLDTMPINSPSTINPFLSFVAQPNEKRWRDFSPNTGKFGDSMSSTNDTMSSDDPPPEYHLS
ncbi:hypothetical protein C8F04DRAFT_1131266 [Mycena alexandri]|uniref:Uncharacterized protein n=1 Tax=Mycena alexandri TaxID=1745969 RepID=A0AAD6SC34_9AGAR|nr:hypothetical protein C8F04DRAFT_1131266 [Mycena alexandri]